MELARVVKNSVDISSELEIFSYDYTDATPREVIARVDLDGIAGGGSYVLQMSINDVAISPNSRIDVVTGRTATILVSRQIPISQGDTLAISVTGLADDTSVNAVVSLRDATPIRAEEILGSGATLVDHDYGGTDALTVQTAEGAGVDNVEIRAYLAADYAANRRGPEYVVARTKTNVNGRWDAPLMLDAGAYTLLLYKQGAIKARTASLTVS